MKQVIFHDSFLTSLGKRLRITIEQDNSELIVQIDLNAKIQSVNHTFTELQYEEEIKIPSTDRREYSRLHKEVVRMKDVMDNFFDTKE